MRNLILQDIVLNQVRRDRDDVEVVLTTGDRILGKVRGFDSFTIIFDLEDNSQIMTYKHSVASLSTKKPVLTDEKQMQYRNI